VVRVAARLAVDRPGEEAVARARGAPGSALTYSRGWVQSNNQIRPPREPLGEHFWICSERMAVRDFEEVTALDTTKALPTTGTTTTEN
jgi:hypothetical protein